MKHRETREVIVCGVLGSIDHPEVVIAGLYTADGELVNIGRTVPLKPDQSAQLAAVLTPAKPGHPWPDEITSYCWGGPDAKKPLTKVQPTVVVEVTADAATQAGQARHGMRYVRYEQTSARTTCLVRRPAAKPTRTFTGSWRQLRTPVDVAGRGSWHLANRSANARF
ncbi:hypothetical protein ACQPYH_28315 [Kribbella sp. CA-245084]|uniref:hypothetical protein n=1 Tax=Kribbella sp. CA-245084 TaxID=3239940 RepID=UPI003D939290